MRQWVPEFPVCGSEYFVQFVDTQSRRTAGENRLRQGGDP
jgi:hypothetical protein